MRKMKTCDHIINKNMKKMTMRVPTRNSNFEFFEKIILFLEIALVLLKNKPEILPKKRILF